MPDQTYPRPLTSLRLTVGGAVRTPELLSGTLWVHQVLGAQVDTAGFSIKSPEPWRGSSIARPTAGQVVTVEVQYGPNAAWTLLFGGAITRVKDTRIAFKTVRWDCEASDYTTLLARAIVQNIYVRTSVTAIVRDLLREYAGDLDPAGIVDRPQQIVRSIALANQSLADVLDTLAGLSGSQWWVGPDKVFHWTQRDDAPTSPNSLTNTSNNFFDLAVETRLDQVRNRIYVQGGLGLSTPVTETFDTDGRVDGVGNTFWLSHDNIVSDQIGMTPSGLVGTFMTLSGQPQRTLIQGYPFSDGSYLGPNGWLVDVETGRVTRGPNTPIPPALTRAVFQYQWKVPIALERQDIDSVVATALAEGTDYRSMVSGMEPVYYWRLADQSGTGIANSSTVNRATAYSGFLSVFSTLHRPASIPIINRSEYGMSFGGDDSIAMPSGVRLTHTGLGVTVACWADGTFLAETGYRGLFSTDFPETGSDHTGISVLVPDAYSFIAPPFYYTLVHRNDGGSSGAMWADSREGIGMNQRDTSTGPKRFKECAPGRFDFVVYTASGTQAALWVNAEIQCSGYLPSVATPSTQRLRIGAAWGTYPWKGRIADVAVFRRALSAQEISRLYWAGLRGGVRDQLVADTSISSFEQAGDIADGLLGQYANVLTDINFSSFVGGWVLGDMVPITITEAGMGRAFSGSGRIQEIEYRWLGTQQVEALVHCIATRYNYVDHALEQLRARNDIVVEQTVAPVNVIEQVGEGHIVFVDSVSWSIT